jgi:Flp pilus assembly protein TadG
MRLQRVVPRLVRDFTSDQRAAALPLFACAAFVMVYLCGMGIDYTLAAQRQAKLSALADAAALAAITPAMMAQSDDVAIAAAKNMFNAQATKMPGINYDPDNPTNLSVTAVDSGPKRTVVVRYQATSINMFPGVLSLQTIALRGSSQSTTSLPPNIDFYLLLDNSPSMAIAATTDGINTMVSNTQPQGGCAFACHETRPDLENGGKGLSNKNAQGKVDQTIDNYALAKRLGVVTRIDNLRAATQTLMTTATQTAQANNTTYRMAIYTFNAGFNTIASLTSDLTQAGTLAGNIDVLQVYTNNYLTSSNKNNDTDTNYDNAMSSINTIMPTPGTGTMGDNPQEVLFFVTDGVEDEMVKGSRQQSVMDPGWCTTIKNRSIRIAVIYTTYLPLPTNTWYNTYIAPFLADIGPTLKSCASPGLFFEVSTDQDISVAMTKLFDTAVQTAYLQR